MLVNKEFGIHKGIVVETLVGIDPFSSISRPIKKMAAITSHGIKYDRHAGTRLADVRENRQHGVGKGNHVFNTREFSAISAEEMRAIANDLGLPRMPPWGMLGENLVIEGIENLSELPPGTTLTFDEPTGNSRTTILAVWAQNDPCVEPGKNMDAHFQDESLGLASRFPKAAMGRRGVVGFVFRSGFIKPGDTVYAHLPSPPR
jgi:MOSC domain-containing protein YiiM